jgi:hypothetical protein
MAKSTKRSSKKVVEVQAEVPVAVESQVSVHCFSRFIKLGKRQVR